MAWFTEWAEARRRRQAAERAAEQEAPKPYRILEPDKPVASRGTENTYHLGPPPSPQVQTVEPTATDGSGEPVL